MEQVILQLRNKYINNDITGLVNIYNDLIESNVIKPFRFNHKYYFYLLNNVQKIRAAIHTEDDSELIDWLVFVSPLIYLVFEKYEN